MNLADTKTFSSLLVLVLVLACSTPSCTPSGDSELAVPVPSATVEMRDGPTAAEIATPTRVVMLGTGTPIPDAHRAGPSIAVVHKGEAYLFDVGAGAIRNATLARYKYDIPSLYPTHICCVFLTHLHSDHMLDLPELAYTMWWRRPRGVRAWGPPGLQEVLDGMRKMMAPDTRNRRSGTQPVLEDDAYLMTATEVADGFVFEKDDLRIEAFEVNHGDIKPAYGYRITTNDKTIVISGDTAVSAKLEEMAQGADILFHEVISDSGLARTSAAFQNYHRQSHTQATDLGRLVNRVRPELLVLYHGLYYGLPEETVLEEVRSVYTGKVVLANDLDSF